MLARLTRHRALVASVLATVLLAAAVSGARASLTLAPQGLHAPRVAEQLGVQRIGDAHAAVAQRFISLDGMAGAASVALVVGGPADVALASPHSPRDWRKLTSGLVPLPLRI